MTTVVSSAWVAFDLWVTTELAATHTFQIFSPQNLWNQYFAARNCRKPNIPKSRPRTPEGGPLPAQPISWWLSNGQPQPHELNPGILRFAQDDQRKKRSKAEAGPSLAWA